MGFSSRRRNNEGRRARELYRHFQPEQHIATFDGNHSLPIHGNNHSAPGSTIADSELNNQAPQSTSTSSLPFLTSTAIRAGSGSSLSPKELVLGNYNATLTSFARLAALRLDVERVLIR